MSIAALIAQLERIGRTLNRWGAELRFTLGLAVLLGVLDVMALLDIVVRLDRLGRGVAWGILMILAGVLAERVVRLLLRRLKPETVAVSIERTFPQLDNHLINFLLFSGMSRVDPFVARYLKMEIPHWDGLDFEALRDWRAFRRAQGVLALVVVLSATPCLLVGRAWAVALGRIVNPFSAVAPVSLTHLLRVMPGDVTIVQGSTVTVSCELEGKPGHRVWLDIRSADGTGKTIPLGSVNGRGVESFSNMLSKVTTDTRYRFRAGDAYAPDWNRITLRPPLAFSSVFLKVVPPSYMALETRRYDAQSTNIDIPAGASVELAVQANGPVTSVVLSGPAQSIPLSGAAGGTNWMATFVVTNDASFTLAALAANGDRTETTVGYRLIPDLPPVVAIKYPRQPVTLLPGGAPSIEFSVTDDFGNDEITIEQSPPEGDTTTPPIVLNTYKGLTKRDKEFMTLWRGDIRKASDSGTLILHVVARDNRRDARQMTTSPALVFSMDAASVAARKQEEQVRKSLADLGKAIALQQENIGKTKRYQASPTTTTADEWGEAAGRQETIRTIIKELLDREGGRSLGNLQITVRKLYATELADVISELLGLSTAREESEKPRRAARALSMEEKILRQLTFAETAATQSRVDGQNRALAGILDGIIVRQDKTLRATTQYDATPGTKVAESLVNEQDSLGSDVNEFIKACRAAAEAITGEEKTDAGFLNAIAVLCEEGKIAGDMLLAAEQLEKNAPREALPHERDAYGKLLAARRKFDEVKAQADKEKNEEMTEALQAASEKLGKLIALEKKLIAEMDAVEAQRDKSGKATDKMEEDFAEIRKNIKDAMLQIPKDLDIFAHLNVGNEMVEDIHSVFEEVTQVKGTETLPEGPVKEKAVAKREYLADDMEKVKERIDDCEAWLKNAPDDTKVSVENADKKEMPEGVALTPLQTEMEDIIGDLLKQDKKSKDKTDDGALNAAVPDMEMGGAITEGDTTTFSAKGKSGNETPEHKEQDGRSNVGRQGMSDGETAAGSGTIGKGDKNIEARRTQDPTQAGQVKADGEADTKATGGGKAGSGKADEAGMGGGKVRMDATQPGSMADFMAMMAKRTDTAYMQASMKGVRSDSLKSAAHHIRQAADAISKGAPIGQLNELKRKAVLELKMAKTELGQGGGGSLDGRASTAVLNDIMEASPDEAPPKFRDLVSEYYRKLNESL